MFDTALRPWIDPPLNATGRWLAAHGVTADQVTVAGFGIGLGAALLVAFGQFGLGLVLILSNRLADGLDGAIARATKPTDRLRERFDCEGPADLPHLFAAESPIAAALVWYGAASESEWKVSERFPKPLEDIIARVECPVLGIFGEADHVISLADVRRFRDCFDRYDKTYTIKVYPGVPHGWLNDTMPGRYRRDAAEAAWVLQLEFLKKIFDPGYDKSRRVQVYESDHAANYDFTKNVRMA